MDRLSDYGSFDGDSNSPRGTKSYDYIVELRNKYYIVK